MPLVGSRSRLTIVWRGLSTENSDCFDPTKPDEPNKSDGFNELNNELGKLDWCNERARPFITEPALSSGKIVTVPSTFTLFITGYPVVITDLDEDVDLGLDEDVDEDVDEDEDVDVPMIDLDAAYAR